MLFTNIEFAKITTFPDIAKYLLENIAFFNFFLEIEQIIVIFAHETWRTLLILNILVEKIYVKYGREVVHVVYLIA